ncbi:hypothetical protein [Arsukibacterium sp.]|uniref:hypothetical protein n=1 Tax=Arsukibacterium sp. TaxID=1977258 RepID=UPI00299F3D5C|nr:hypothetical protein [Arsukibacterium sp.]MDX1536536.1 hypothetical protein [Arsukibacterium sp.]
MNSALHLFLWIAGLTTLCYFVFLILTHMVEDKRQRGIEMINGREVDMGLQGSAYDDELLQAGLHLWPGKDGENELISAAPTAAIISELMAELYWQEISYVTLVFADSSRVEVSGSLDDGFSAMYQNGDEEQFADPAPASITEMTDMLCAFKADPQAALKQYGFV